MGVADGAVRRPPRPSPLDPSTRTHMDTILFGVGQALKEAFDMAWEVFWPLVLGFGLSAAVQALVSHKALARLLGDDSPRSLSLATLFGIASSSCSYAAVALARSIFRK